MTSTDTASGGPAASAELNTVPVTINGHQIEARPGELVITAAERSGVYIPRFCYHERMSPVGMCRMCLVEIDTGRGPQLQPSCMVPVAAGMTVDTQSKLTLQVQQGVLEQLLINHPLDCPVCDKGGECSLQDQTLAYGPGESRFVEEKRHFTKPIPVSTLVDLDRERCILCDRCTRFADEVAGDPLITFAERGNETHILTFPDEPFSSYFSGNTVQLCPVGALTATPYRFKARPWDLSEVESTCVTCSVGCGMTIQASRDRLVRFVGTDIDAVNHGWLCDKGRFAFDVVNSDHRVTTPLVRVTTDSADADLSASADVDPSDSADADLSASADVDPSDSADVDPSASADADPSDPASRWQTEGWNAALRKVATAVRNARPGAVAIIGGAHGTNEDAYAWAKLARTVLATTHLDAQLGDGFPPALLTELPPATIDEACAADTVLLLAPDLKEELPVLYLRLRGAAEAGTTQLIEVGPVATGLRPQAHRVVECLGGETAVAVSALLDPNNPNSANPDLVPDSTQADIELADRLADGSLVVVLGRTSLAESDAAITDAARLLAARLPHARFLPVLRRANVRGALTMGLTPAGSAVLDAAVPLAGSAVLDAAVPLAGNTVLDAAGILKAAAAGAIDVLFLLGSDPIADFPDVRLAQAGLANAGLVVAIDAFLNASVQTADVVLPAALFGEKDGTTTNLEGRVRAVSKLVTAPGVARPDWLIAAELARHCGGDLGFTSRTEITDEIASVFASHADCGTAAGVEQLAGEGVLVVPAATAGAATGAVGATAIAATTPQSTKPETLPRDSYALRLVSTRTLYDAGVTVAHTPSLASLAPGPALLVHPIDFVHIGVSVGTKVLLRSAHATITVPVFDSAAVSRGNAVLRLNQPVTPATPSDPPSANNLGTLINFADNFTDVRIEVVAPTRRSTPR